MLQLWLIVCELLSNAEERKRLDANARAFAQANYDLQSVCLPEKLDWIAQLGLLSPLN